MSSARYRSFSQIQREHMRIREREITLEEKTTVATVLALPPSRIQQFRSTYPGMIAPVPDDPAIKLKKANEDLDQARARVTAMESDISELRSKLADTRQRLARKTIEFDQTVRKVQCGVCYENEKDCLLDCGHGYCSECVERLNSCAFCGNNNLEVFPLYL